MAKYHSLLIRESKAAPWSIHFGDYDREVVEAERDDVTEHEYKRGDTKIITTKGTQTAITAAVAKLNGKQEAATVDASESAPLFEIGESPEDISIKEMIRAAEAYLATLRADLASFEGVLLGQGFVVMGAHLIRLEFDITDGAVTNPRVVGGSAKRSQRFTQRDAESIARNVTNGKGETAEALHVTDALRRQIADHEFHLATLRELASKQGAPK